MFIESGGNPAAVGDNGSSFGLAQWHNSRAVGLLKYAQQSGRNPADWQTQLDYTRHELDGPERGTRQRLQMAKNSAEAQAIFTDGFERPAQTPGQLQQAVSGSFTGHGQQFVDGLFRQMQAAREQHDREILAAREPNELARAMTRRFLLDEQKPPQNMGETWNQ
jgi:tail lysozyme